MLGTLATLVVSIFLASARAMTVNAPGGSGDTGRAFAMGFSPLRSAVGIQGVWRESADQFDQSRTEVFVVTAKR